MICTKTHTHWKTLEMFISFDFTLLSQTELVQWISQHQWGQNKHSSAYQSLALYALRALCALAHSFTVKESKLYTWNRSQINTVTSRSGSAQIECDAMCGGGCVYQLIKSYLSLWQTVPERPVLLTPKNSTLFPRMCVRVCVCQTPPCFIFFNMSVIVFPVPHWSASLFPFQSWPHFHLCPLSYFPCYSHPLSVCVCGDVEALCISGPVI